MRAGFQHKRKVCMGNSAKMLFLNLYCQLSLHIPLLFLQKACPLHVVFFLHMLLFCIVWHGFILNHRLPPLSLVLVFSFCLLCSWLFTLKCSSIFLMPGAFLLRLLDATYSLNAIVIASMSLPLKNT